MTNAPRFTVLNDTIARAYAEWLASFFNTTLADTAPTVERIGEDGEESAFYLFTMRDGTSAAVWFENGAVYGEA